MNKKTIKDIDIEGKKVLVRCDFNVPFDENRNITDNRRIIATIPTIKYLLDNNCKIILCSHLGRPKGEIKKELSMDIVAKELTRVLGQEVKLAKDVVGEDAKRLAKNLGNREIMLLENTRFEKGEDTNDDELAKELASMAEVFVVDAFGTAHRAHASVIGVAKYLPAVAGVLMEKEIDFYTEALGNPKRPIFI